MGEDANGNEILSNNPGNAFGYDNSDFSSIEDMLKYYQVPKPAPVKPYSVMDNPIDSGFKVTPGMSDQLGTNFESDYDVMKIGGLGVNGQETPGMTGFEMGQLGLAGLNSAAGLYQYFDTGRDTAREKLTGIKMQNEDNRAKIDAWKRHDAGMRRSGLRD